MATANDIIKGALRLLKVKESGETLSADEAADGLTALNDLLDSWSNERWMHTHITELTQTLVSGDGVYTVCDASNTGDLQLPETLNCGRLPLADQDFDSWTSLTAGHFRLNVKAAGVRNVTVDCSTATSMTTLAALIQAAIRSDLSNTNINCTFNDTEKRFEITTNALPSESISYLTAASMTGTITTGNGVSAVTGSGTAFLTEVFAGDVLAWTDDASASKTGTVLSVASDTSLTLTAVSTSVSTTVSFSLDGTDISSKMRGLSTQATNSTGTDFWPVHIQSAFIRDSSDNDYPLYPLTDEQYGKICDKTTTSTYSDYYYYERAYPVAKIHLWDIPSAAYTLHLRVWPQWTQFASGSTTVSLPPGYKRALIYNLAVEISPEYQDASALVMQKAIESKSWIKTVNTRIPVMRSPARFIAVSKRDFDIDIGE